MCFVPVVRDEYFRVLERSQTFYGLCFLCTNCLAFNLDAHKWSRLQILRTNGLASTQTHDSINPKAKIIKSRDPLRQGNPHPSMAANPSISLQRSRVSRPPCMGRYSTPSPTISPPGAATLHLREPKIISYYCTHHHSHR